MQGQTKCDRCQARGKKFKPQPYPQKSLRWSYHFPLAAASILKPSRPLRMFKIANIANSKTILCEGNLNFWKLSWSSVIPTVLRFFAYGSRSSKNLSHFKGQDLNMFQNPLTAGASATLATTTILFIALDPASHRNIVVSPKNINRKKLKLLSFIYSLTQLVLLRSGAG